MPWFKRPWKRNPKPATKLPKTVWSFSKKKGKWVRNWTGKRQKWAGRAIGAAGPFLPGLDVPTYRFSSIKKGSFAGAAKAAKVPMRYAGPAGVALNIYGAWQYRKGIWRFVQGPSKGHRFWAKRPKPYKPPSLNRRKRRRNGSSDPSVRRRSLIRISRRRRKLPYCAIHRRRHWCPIVRRNRAKR